LLNKVLEEFSQQNILHCIQQGT